MSNEQEKTQGVEDAAVGQGAKTLKEVVGGVDEVEIPGVPTRPVGGVGHDVETGMGSGDAFAGVPNFVRREEVLIWFGVCCCVCKSGGRGCCCCCC